MFIKYPKTYRILVPQINVKGKHFHCDADVKKLLGGQVILKEKMDGANVGIIRHKDTFKLQKRGSLVDLSEHAQFNYFKAWSQLNQDKIMKIPEGSIIYGELMYAKHTVFYDKLPDYFLAFAWMDRATGEYKHWSDLEELCAKIGLHTVPFIAQGHYNKDELFDMIPDPSAYGSEPAEGLVVWNYKNGMRGKVVREEFVKEMNESDHWMNKSVIRNVLQK